MRPAAPLAALIVTLTGLLLVVSGVTARTRLYADSTDGSADRAAPPTGAAARQQVAPHGAGTFRVADGSSPRTGTGLPVRYRIEVENGIDQDRAAFADAVDRTAPSPAPTSPARCRGGPARTTRSRGSCS